MKTEETMHITTARAVCQEFADRLGVTFVDKGEVGFGRDCVGFAKMRPGQLADGVGNYIDHNPLRGDFHMRPPGDYHAPGCQCEAVRPPHFVPHAYHKHDCLAVLAYSGNDGEPDYDTAIVQLAMWVRHIDSQGTAKLKEYPTGAQGLQALISGTIGHCIVVE